MILAPLDITISRPHETASDHSLVPSIMVGLAKVGYVENNIFSEGIMLIFELYSLLYFFQTMIMLHSG